MMQNNFLHELQIRAGEQRVLADIPFPNIFLFVSRWLGESPWKILIPVAILITLILQVYSGEKFDDRILWLFGSL